MENTHIQNGIPMKTIYNFNLFNVIPTVQKVNYRLKYCLSKNLFHAKTNLKLAH